MTDKARCGQKRSPLERMEEGQCIVCGPWPYLMGIKLTVKGYNFLKSKRYSIKRFAPDALTIQKFNRKTLIGVTRALRKRLDDVLPYGFSNQERALP